MQKIQTGKGDTKYRYTELGEVIYVQAVFGGTSPEQLAQDYVYGNNDILTAKAARFVMKFGH